MKKYLTGLCMCWGNFCFIPGPKKWDENARSLMLGWLPLVGLIIGVIWAIIYFGLVYLSFPYLFVVFVMTFVPFILSGFIHVDGFMDCNDALLSRGTLDKRCEILKDSRCGMFAIITVIFTVLCMYSCLGSAVSVGIDFVNLIAITVCSRSVAGLEVLLSNPMSTSQYKHMHDEEERSLSKAETKKDAKKDTKKEAKDAVSAFDVMANDSFNFYDNIKDFSVGMPEEQKDDTQTAYIENDEEDNEDKPASIKQGVYLLCAVFLICLALFGLFCTYYLSTALVVIATILGSLVSAIIAKKGLGGMNGDIAGYSIIWGETVGIIMLAIV